MRLLSIIVAAFALALLAGQNAALAYWRSDRTVAAPGYASGLWANDPVMRLRSGEQFTAQPDQLVARAQSIEQAAREVLQRSPLDVIAMRQLGVLAELRAAGSGREYVALAERISRRDLTTELLSIDHAASQSDAATSLRHFDHALMVYPQAKHQLLPVVASQLDQPDVRRALVAYADRLWLKDFVVSAVEHDVQPEALMQFYSDLEGRIAKSEVQDGTIRLVRWLANNNHYSALGSFANRLPGLAPDTFAPIGLTAATTNARFAPLSWTLLNDASVETQADGNAVLLRVEPGITAIAASRLTLLQAGDYEFAQMIEYQADAPRAELEWQVTCPEGGGEQLLQATKRQAGARAIHRARLTIRAGCAVQFWQLRASAAPSQFASSARIAGIALKRR